MQWRGQKSWKLKLVGREVFPTRFPPGDVEVDNGVVSIMSVVDGVMLMLMLLMLYMLIMLLVLIMVLMLIMLLTLCS